MKRLNQAVLASFLVAFAGLSGCASKPDSVKRPLDLPFYQVYSGTYDTVWQAVVRVLDIYSITVASREAGLLQTEWSDYRFNRELYEHPDHPDSLEQIRYRLKIKLSKGIVSQSGKPAVRVQIVKELEQYKNFVSDWERVPTDEFEERVILYRIGQRIRIADALKKKTTNSTSAFSAENTNAAPKDEPPSASDESFAP